MHWWHKEGPKNWNEVLAIDQPETVQQLRQCTHAGRPFGTETFVVEIGKKIGRTWVRAGRRIQRQRVRSMRQISSLSFEDEAWNKKNRADQAVPDFPGFPPGFPAAVGILGGSLVMLLAAGIAVACKSAKPERH